MAKNRTSFRNTSPLGRSRNLQHQAGTANYRSAQDADLGDIKTNHVRARQQQRSVTDAQVAIVMDWGRDYPRVGECFLRYMGDREIARAQKAGVDTTGCRGVGVILTKADHVLITVIRNTNLAKVKHK